MDTWGSVVLVSLLLYIFEFFPTPAMTTMNLIPPPAHTHSSLSTLLIVIIKNLDGLAHPPIYNLGSKAAFYKNYSTMSGHLPMFQYRK